jgi:arginase
MKKYSIVPYVCGAGASTLGVERGALDLYEYGIHDYLRGHGLDIEWYENPQDMYESPYGRRAHDSIQALGEQARRDLVYWHCKHLRDSVVDIVEQNSIPVVLGGDHSMAAGSISGFIKAKQAYGRVGVLWIDAHPDLNTSQSSYSKAYHGMPARMLLGEGDKDFVDLAGKSPALEAENLFYIGVRDFDKAELEFLNEVHIGYFTDEQVNEMGAFDALKHACESLLKHADHLFLSFDIDALVPEEVPATGTPVSGGISKKDLLPALREICASFEFEGIEITEYNPVLDGRDITLETILQILDSLFFSEVKLSEQAG